MQVTRLGEWAGKAVDQVSLVSSAGVQVDIMNFGVVVRDWRVPVSGGLRSVVLGFETFDPYPAQSPYFGAIAGRVANRITGAQFELDGKTYTLPAGEHGHCLHGGPEGLAHQVWEMEPDSQANRVRFTHFSPDGAMGFPGNVRFEAIYTLEGHRLRLDMSATTDRATPISLVQHQYFNLGTGEDVLDHHVTIDADRFTPLRESLAPTGEVRSVEGTVYDLRRGRTLKDEAGQPVDYDINLCLTEGRDSAEPAVVCAGPDGELTLKLWTAQPGVQLYNSVWTGVTAPGLGGRSYSKHAGLCFEDQAWPDALHHANFPSIITTPDTPYAHWCEIEIE